MLVGCVHACDSSKVLLMSQSQNNSRTYCSELALADGAQLCGTAVTVDLWLLIEYARPWKPKALIDNDLSLALKTHLDGLPAQVRECAGKILRVQFVKQAASAEQDHPRLLLAGADGLHAGRLSSYDELLDITAEQLAAGCLPDPFTCAGPIYLVCTNGQRDVCCARFGLPLYEQLRVEFGERIWQTTHIGGHRYAPNLVSLPTGVVYGFVQPEQGIEVVTQDQQGILSLANLRGRAGLPKPAQAAEYYLRQEKNLYRHGDLKYTGLEEQDSGGVARFVDVQGHGYAVTLQRSMSQPVIASCDDVAKPMEQFALVHIHQTTNQQNTPT